MTASLKKPIKAIMDALALLPPKMKNNLGNVLVMLLAIGLQESRFTARKQHGGGPARGWWQFEKGGGVAGVLKHSTTINAARAFAVQRLISPDTQSVYEALAEDDVLAAGMARLLLWTDAGKLPEFGDAQAAWNMYQRVWRPGKPHPETWPELYAQAMEAVMAYLEGDQE